MRAQAAGTLYVSISLLKIPIPRPDGRSMHCTACALPLNRLVTIALMKTIFKIDFISDPSVGVKRTDRQDPAMLEDASGRPRSWPCSHPTERAW